jgi:hypothetical protein
MTEQELRDLLAEYLEMLQKDPSAEDFMAAMLTDDFETGFEGGYLWKGLDGLREFLARGRSSSTSTTRSRTSSS